MYISRSSLKALMFYKCQVRQKLKDTSYVKYTNLLSFVQIVGV